MSTFTVTLSLAVYSQSVRLGAKPLEFTTRHLFWRLNRSGYNPYVTFSLTGRWICLLWTCLAFVKCTYRTYNMLSKFRPCALYTCSLSVQAFQSRSCLSYLSWATMAAWAVVGLTAAIFKPLISSMSGFALLYAANMFILMILYDLCLLPTSNDHFTILSKSQVTSFYSWVALIHLWSWALLENQPIVQLLKIFPAFYGTRRFITVLRSQEPTTGPYPEPHQSNPYHAILSLLRSILILSWLSNQYPISIPLPPFVLHALSISSSLTWSF
jgi:hypothetical protein